MAKALFVMLPSMGHINAVLGVARCMEQIGNEIYFSGGVDPFLDCYIKHQGFQLVDLASVPFGLNYYDELQFYKKLNKNKYHLIEDRVKDETFFKRCLSYKTAIDELKPDFLFLDSFLGNDYLCLYDIVVNSKIKFCFINSMGYFKHTIPSGLSSTVFFERIKGKLKQVIIQAKDKLNSLHELIFLLGRSTDVIVNKKIMSLGLSEKISRINNSPISSTYDNIKELVLSSKQFELFLPENKDMIYVGSQLFLNRTDIISVEDRDNLMGILKEEKKIIYVSAGTAFPSNKIKRFIKIIRDIAHAFVNYCFIFSNISGNEHLKAISLPPNVHLFGIIPQHPVLAKSTVFITHGGLNSIKEAIYFKIPMMVIPLNNNYDQQHNAQIVNLLKIGLTANIKKTGKIEIAYKLKLLIKNVEFKNNIYNLDTELRSSYNEEMLTETLLNIA